MNNKVKWGIIGPGHIARKFAADLLLSENGTLHAVASRDADKAKSFADQYKASTFYSDYESLAMDSDVDVVYVATPHAFHFEHTMLCLKNGKSVLCEKPMGMTPLEVQTMIAEAQKRKLFLMEGLWTRFIPATEKVLDLLADNAIGTIINIKADFGFNPPFDRNHRLFNKALGGGSLMDIGIYPLYLALLVSGKPDSIKATAKLTVTGVDSSCRMDLTYKNECRANLLSTLEEETPTEAIITGTNGYIKLHTRFHHSKIITIEMNRQKKEIVLDYNNFGYLFEIEEVNGCLMEGKTESVKLPLHDSLALSHMLDMVRKNIGLY
ncbi:MAG: oxidoreductase [Marinilabiliales bacterium]|nr:MAG: oxidoreductase [Marinilabiliales bacterium]